MLVTPGALMHRIRAIVMLEHTDTSDDLNADTGSTMLQPFEAAAALLPSIAPSRCGLRAGSTTKQPHETRLMPGANAQQETRISELARGVVGKTIPDHTSFVA